MIYDSPQITNNTVRAEFQITRPVVGVRCFLRSRYDRIWQDCKLIYLYSHPQPYSPKILTTGSSGQVSFPILRPGPHVLKVQAYNRKTDVAFVKRGFVVNFDPNFCSLVLVNRGVTISGDGTRAVVQVRLYGPAIHLSCVLDEGFPFICKYNKY